MHMGAEGCTPSNKSVFGCHKYAYSHSQQFVQIKADRNRGCINITAHLSDYMHRDGWAVLDADSSCPRLLIRPCMHVIMWLHPYSHDVWQPDIDLYRPLSTTSPKKQCCFLVVYAPLHPSSWVLNSESTIVHFLKQARNCRFCISLLTSYHKTS